MHRISILIITIIALVGVAGLAATEAEQYAGRMSESDLKFVDSLETRLRNAPSCNDSVRLLYNIFDVSPNKRMKDKALARLYNAATRAGRQDVMLDVLTHGINLHFKDDSLLTKIEHEMAALAPSDKLREAELFLRMRRIGQQLAEADDTTHAKNLADIIKRYNTAPPADPFDHAEMLYALCVNLGRASQGELLEVYVDKLMACVESLKLPMGAVRNLIYTRAAPYFTNNGKHAKAVETDKKMLNIIDSLVTSYRAQGRIYRRMEPYRYTCYRRLLGNYKALSPLEIEHFNKEINKLAASNTSVRNDLNNNERAKIFYALATKQWQQALDAIKRQLDNPANKAYRKYLLAAMVEAAEKTGDRQAQLAAAMELYQLAKADLENRSSDRYRELQVLYDIVELRDQNASLVSSQNLAKNKRKNTIILVGCGISVVLLALVLLLWYQTVKLKRIAERRRLAAKRFHHERDRLYDQLSKLGASRNAAVAADSLKTDLLNTVSHEMKTPIGAIAEYSRLIVDCIPDDQRHYLNRFAKIIEHNSKIVTRLVDDVLDITDMESGNAHVHREPSSIYDICNMAMLSVFENGQPQNPEVTMVFNSEGRPDRNIDTDSARVAQILVNLLSNAAKFTAKGRIVLDFDVEGDTARFIVEDTGVGVPAKAADKIFERFAQLDSHTAGCGLGLYISRMTANLIGGKIYLDTSYRHGARFVVEIEIGPKHQKA